MPIRICPNAPALPPELIRRLDGLDLPLLGHFLEVGFVDPALRRLAGTGHVVGRAVTVRVVAPDSALVHRATEFLGPGDVLVIDTGGDARHASVGGVVGNAISAAGALGVVIDGVCTDIATLQDLGLVVYARGTSLLTTKLHGLDAGGINVPVVTGGVAVLPGYVVIGDDQGLLIADPADIAAVLDAVKLHASREPEKLRRLWNGEKLADVSVANERLRTHQETR